MRNLCALAVLRLATAAIVQPMTGTGQMTAAGPMTMEAVPLLTAAPSTERSPVVRKASRELLRSLGYVGDAVGVGGRDDDLDDQTTEEDYYDDTTPIPSTTSAATVKISRRQGIIANANSPENRTKLYPVGRLWDWAVGAPKGITDGSTDRTDGSVDRTDDSIDRTEGAVDKTDGSIDRTDSSVERTDGSIDTTDGSVERTLPPRPMGMMALLDAAFSCLWSGLGFECFSLKVVPMFRAMMGFPPVHPFGHPYYALPRTTDTEVQKSQEEDEEEDEDHEEDETGNQTGRRRRRRHFGLKMVKMGLMGLAALKTFVLPVLSILSIASGKAIVFSLAAVVLTLAVGWSAAKSAERRVYDSHERPPYYM